MSEAVVSTRIRLARNLKEYPFPIRLSADKAREIVDRVGEALKDCEIKFHRIDLDNIPDTIRVAMIERHLVSPDFISEQDGRAVYLSDDNTVSIMVNEEDHIRLQVIKDGFELKEAYALADQIDNILSKKLNFAFHERLGYLTQCPTNLGTGMRASVMLHLPALRMTGVVNSIGANLSKLGLTMRGLYGESSKPAGAFYQLSNQVTLGISEKAAIDNLQNITTQLIAQEMRSRENSVERYRGTGQDPPRPRHPQKRDADRSQRGDASAVTGTIGCERKEARNPLDRQYRQADRRDPARVDHDALRRRYEPPRPRYQTRKYVTRKIRVTVISGQ